MVSSLRTLAIPAVFVGAGFLPVHGNPPAGPYRVVVNTPPAEVVIVEEEAKNRCLKLFGGHKKKDRIEEPAAYYVQVPAMVPQAAPCASAAPAPAMNSCLKVQSQDLRATIERLKQLRTEHEAEIAAIDSALAPVAPSAPKPSSRAVSAAGPNPARNELQDVNDKLDYLTALVDALAEDVRKSNPKVPLTAFDELNKFRKPKP